MCPSLRYFTARCEDSIGCMHGSSEPDLRNWKSPTCCTHLQTQPGRIQPIDSSQLDPVQTARRPAPG
ncbi:hypothetical protein L560_2850 [Bordetella pertussis STO1-CHOC-0018]|nr:hypothetical protein L560_2850 [Bordetella pertussis STO1-CHOC-0018]